MTPRFVAGPPGTGKTHTFIVKLYKELLNKYSPENIIILSHTNVAADEIRHAILELPEMKEKGLRKKFFKYRISTIHSFCKSKVPKKEKFLVLLIIKKTFNPITVIYKILKMI